MKHILHLYLTQDLISSKLCCLFLVISFQVQAQIAGDLRSSTSGSWNQPNTWERYTGTVWQAAGIGANNPGHIPDTNSSVFIQTGHLINLDSTSFCNSISINGGTLEANIYTLNVKNNWTNNGDFIANTGLVNLFGPNQLIGGSSITSFNHLTVATTVTAELTQHLVVLGNLTTTSTGTLKTESFNVTVSGLTSVEGLSSIKDIGSGSKQYIGGLFINGGSFVSTVPITIPSTGILNVALGNLTMNAGTSTFLVEAGAPITISGGNLSIAAGQTFSLNSPVNMSGGSINGNGSLFINSTFNMSGGVLAGSGTSTVTAPNIMNISGTLTTISRSITTPTLNWTSGGFTIGSGSILSTITAQISSSGVISGNGTLVVSGIGASLTKSSNSNATINCALNLNSPSVFNINSGTLTLGGGGILSSATTVVGGTTLQFNNGAFNINSLATITGNGNFVVSGGNVTSNILLGLSSSSSILVSAGTFTLAAASTLAPPVTIQGGTLALNTPTTFNNLVLVTGGSINCNAPVTLSSNSGLTMSLGTININSGTGTFSIPSTLTTTISGGTVSISSGQIFSVAGIMNMSGGTINGVGTYSQSNIINMTGGTFNGNGITNIIAPGFLNVNGIVSISRTLNTTSFNWISGNISLSKEMTISTTMTVSANGIMSGNGPLISPILTKTGTTNTTINSDLIIGSGGMSITAGTFVFGANSTISGNLSIHLNAKAGITNGEIVDVQTLTLGGNGAIAGSWGSNSSSANNKNDTYFNLGITGIVQVTTNTCIPPVASINASTTLLSCAINSITLNAIGNGFYLWDNGSTSASRIINSSGTYNLTLTSNGCGTSFSNIIITQDTNTPSVANIASSFIKNCFTNPNGTIIGELPESGFTYSWNPSSGLSNPNIANPLANPSISTSYTLTKTKITSGCFATATILFDVNTSLPTANAGNSFTKTCISNINGANIGETNDANATYSWSPVEGLNNANISDPIANPAATTTYTVTKTNIVNGCSTNASITVNVNNTIPIVSAGNAFTKTCVSNINGATIGELNDVTAIYSWSPVEGLSNANISNPIANPTTTTTYTVTKTNTVNGCSASASVTVTVDNNLPNINSTASNTSICNGISTILNASGANDFVWQPGNVSGNSITVTPSENTTYTVTGTNAANGCTNNSTLSILVNDLPSLSVTASLSTICQGNNTSISISGADSYSWSPNNLTGSSVIVTPSATTVYTITGTNTLNGCSNTITKTIIVNPLPPVSATALANSICQGNSTTITATGAVNYSWEPGGSITNSINVTPLTPTTYTVIGTNSFGCTNSATQTITTNNCNVTANIILFIEGYYAGSGTMQPVRANEGIGTSLVNVDLITVELHQTNAPFSMVASSLFFLKTNGTATASFTNVLPGSYYLVIKHRNALETWSKNPISTLSGTVNYNFSTSANQAYGDNMTLIDSGIWAFYSGDLTSDDNIDLLDLSFLELDINEFSFGYLATDLNGDGNVDLLDSPILENNINGFIFSQHP